MLMVAAGKKGGASNEVDCGIIGREASGGRVDRGLVRLVTAPFPSILPVVAKGVRATT